MDTQTLQVFSLRGMDERWIVDPQDALYIQDMTWTSNDSWRTSGGFVRLYNPDPAQDIIQDEPEREGNPTFDSEPEESDPIDVVYKFASINSIHWFAQHNGARQWLIFEEQNYATDPVTGELLPDGKVTLKAFDGSLLKSSADDPTYDKPLKTLIQYENIGSSPFTNVNDRSETALSIRTQSQSYGGRIYFVNGFDEPLVFDGEACERAGFYQTPPSPSAGGVDFTNSATFPYAIGDPEDLDAEVIDKDFSYTPSGGSDSGVKINFKKYFITPPKSISFWSAHRNVPYWGVGSTSAATIGAGLYSFKGGSERPKYSSEFTTLFHLKYNYYAGEQVDTRKCGYQYRVTYVNERGQESEPSEPSSVATVENGRGGKKRCRHGKGFISLNIPVGPKECVARRIYRTRNLYDSNGDMYNKGDGQTFYFLQEIPDNMTTVFVDGHPDTALGELLDVRSLGNFPSRAKFLAIFKNTMFAAGTELNEVLYSAPLFPEVFPKDHVIIVGDDDGGPITGMRTTKNALVVFKSRGIYLIKGSPATGFSAQTLNKDIGCIAPNSICEIPGLGLSFLSEKSVYILEGALENTGSVTGVVNIGAEIPNQLELMNLAASIRASAAVYQRDKEYWLSIPTQGSEKNNLCLIYHYEIGSWSVRKDFPVDCMVVSKDHRGYLFMGSNDSDNRLRSGILVYTRGEDNKGYFTKELYSDGSIKVAEKVNINAIYETVSNDYQSVFTNFRPAHVMAYAVGYGNNGLNVNTRVNRSIDQVRTTIQSGEQQDHNDVYPVYGSARFNSDRWTAYRPTVLRYDISTSHKGPVRELSISFAATDGNKIEIIGYDLEAKVGEQRSIKPLNKALRPSRR